MLSRSARLQTKLISLKTNYTAYEARGISAPIWQTTYIGSDKLNGDAEHDF